VSQQKRQRSPGIGLASIRLSVIATSLASVVACSQDPPAV
jgi:hypothetical protein